MSEPIINTSGRSAAESLLSDLIEPEAYIGEVYSLSYEEALVQVQDTDRKKVGGIPALSLLAATRVNPKKGFDVREEDSSVILLRVIDRGELPTDAEFTRLRIFSANKVTDDAEKLWDDDSIIDPMLKGVLNHTGIRCRVLGTFYVDNVNGCEALVFGSDLSNYYPNRGLKVFKLRGEALGKAVNYRRPDAVSDGIPSVAIGEVRYASTNRPFQNISSVPVAITPTDLLGQRTALFGMTRTGKSNTAKIILKSIFQLRWENGRKIGQLVFDPNGEYANENTQDKETSPDAMKNVWMCAPEGARSSAKEEVLIYGAVPHSSGPDRRLMHLNFYSEGNLQIGKDMIDSVIASDSAKYISNFRDVRFDRPEDGSSQKESVKHRRKALCYRALLFKAGLAAPKGMLPDTAGLFDEVLLDAMTASTGRNAPAYCRSSDMLGRPNITWGQLASAMIDLYNFIHDRDSGFREFDAAYTARYTSQTSWADEDLVKILEMFRYGNGPSVVGRIKSQHGTDKDEDYADEIYSELEKGSLVIVDQSSGDAELNAITAERIMQRIFDGNRSRFVSGEQPKEIVVYIEEAHNLLPAAQSRELSNIWIRTAKEGAKYHIGLIYATQEVSSVQRNVLRNTANWFIGHLNSTDETSELNKFYDFGDFEMSILRADERGFLRIKTLSNPYVIPVQIRKFTVQNEMNY